MIQEQTEDGSAVRVGEAIGELIVQGGMVCLSLLPFVLCFASFVQAKKKGDPGWKFASILFGLLGLLTLSCAGLVLANLPDDDDSFVSPELPMEFSRDGQRVTSTDRRMQLDLHSGWQAAPGLLEGAVLELEQPDQSESMAVFIFAKSEYPDELDECADYLTDYYLQDHEDNLLVSRAEVQVGGYDAVRTEIDANFGGELTVQLLMLVEVGDTYFLLMGWGPRSHRVQALSSLDELVSTFELVDE